MPLNTSGLQINEALYFLLVGRTPHLNQPTRLEQDMKLNTCPLVPFSSKRTLSVVTDSCSYIVMCVTVPKRKIYLYEDKQTEPEVN